MSSESTNLSPRLNPTVSWTTITDGPLRGLSLARETGTLLAWDESSHLYLLAPDGERLTDARAPARILDAAIADAGSLIAVLIEGPRLLLLDSELQSIADRPTLAEVTTLAVDAHGRYVVVSAKTGKSQFLTRYGKTAGHFETMQPLSQVRFVPSEARLVGSSAYGTLFALDLIATEGSFDLEVEEVWRSQMMSNVGRLEVTGDGGMILASCFTHGVQRFDNRGRNEGAYHLAGTAAHAVPDFGGRLIAVATTEGELYLLNRSGNVRWKTGLPRGPVALVCDALGRSVVYGLPSGELARLEIEESARTKPAGGGPTPAVRKPAATRTVSGGTRSGTIRPPAWTIPIADSEEQAETAVLAVLDDPVRVAVMTNTNRLTTITAAGGLLGQAPAITGVGRILRTAPGWIVAATDRQIVVHDARRNQSERLDLSLVELTHLEASPDRYGLGLVQERDRIGRVSLAGRWVWKAELRTGVEELAVGPEAVTAVTTDDGLLLLYDAAGEPRGRFAPRPPEPLLLLAAPAGERPDVAWITLARRAQILRGHSLGGEPVWESPVPWEAWRLHPAGRFVVAEAPDGRAMAFDASGHARAQARNMSSTGPVYPGPDDEIHRVIRQGEHLIGTELSGRVRWRFVAQEAIGPVAAGSSGVAALIGRSLAWFPAAGGDDADEPDGPSATASSGGLEPVSGAPGET